MNLERYDFEHQWTIYSGHVLPPDASPYQITETKRAFFAGAYSLALMWDRVPHNHPEADAIKIMTHIHADIKAFCMDEVAKDIARAADGSKT